MFEFRIVFGFGSRYALAKMFPEMVVKCGYLRKGSKIFGAFRAREQFKLSEPGCLEFFLSLYAISPPVVLACYGP